MIKKLEWIRVDPVTYRANSRFGAYLSSYEPWEGYTLRGPGIEDICVCDSIDAAHRVGQEIYENLLDSHPIRVEWTAWDHELARKEGWGICQVDHEGHPPWELSKLDEMEKFPGDCEVWVHVFVHAVLGSSLHIRALAYLREVSPQEFVQIAKYLSKMGTK